MSLKSAPWICLLGCSVLAQPALAEVFDFNWARPSDAYIAENIIEGWRYGIPNGEVNDAAGIISGMSASYDTDNARFSYSVTFGGQPDGTNFHQTDAFWLVVTPGAMPAGLGDGQAAHIYFDGSNIDPLVSIFAYNGMGDGSSYYDGSGADGIQAPDAIFSSFSNPGAVLAIDNMDNGDGTTTMSFELDAGVIGLHNPMYGGDEDWTGVAFDEMIGVWLHSFSNSATTYGDDGMLDGFTFARHGWFDGENLPAPGAFALLGLAALVAIRRKR